MFNNCQSEMKVLGGSRINPRPEHSKMRADAEHRHEDSALFPRPFARTEEVKV